MEGIVIAKRKIPTIPGLSGESQRFLGDLQQETDRGAGLMAAALLDDLLAAVPRAVFVEGSKDAEELLTGGRELGGFYTKVRLANSVGLLGPIHRDDLDLARRVQNEVARRHTGCCFEAEPIRSLCRELPVAERFLTGSKAEANLTEVFVFSIAMLASELMLRGPLLKHAQPDEDFRFEPPPDSNREPA